MRMRKIYLSLLCVMALSFFLSGCTTTQLKDSEDEADAGPVEFESLVEFDKDIHFLGQGGTDVTLSAGGYYVDPVQDGLRFTSADQEDAEAVVVDAETTTHDRSVDAPEPVSHKEGENQQVVMVLMPDGKALQAVGSSTGLQSRGVKFRKMKGLKGMLSFLPKITSIFTAPKLGAITPGGTLYIKGKYFKSSKGKVNLHLSHPVPQVVGLQVESWTDTKLKVKIPHTISGVMDHQAKIQVLSSKGLGGMAWKAQFYAKRRSKQLKAGDPAVKVTHCSTGADKNHCNGLNTSTGGSCFAAAIPPVFKTGAIYARHVNCDSVIDWDKGKDRYSVQLKNGWVFKKVEWTNSKSSGSEKIHAPDYGKLRKTLPGTTSWKPSIRWEVSPGPDQLSYVYWLTIEGPKGVPHY